MPESFIPVWMSVGEAENFKRTLHELDDSEAGLPERELSLIEGALERERRRTYAEMDAEQKAASSSPQAEVQDCDNSHLPNCTVKCPVCKGTGKQSPAEPQGDVVEKLAKRFYDDLPMVRREGEWDQAREITREFWRQQAQPVIAKLTPLIHLEVEERLLSDEAIEAALRVWCQGFDAFPRGTQREAIRRQRLAFLAALAPVSSEPGEGADRCG